MTTKLKLIWWLIVDTMNQPRPDALTVSHERINRELRDREDHHSDEATAKCITRVKRRMLLGKLSPDAPMFKKIGEASGETTAPTA